MRKIFLVLVLSMVALFAESAKVVSVSDGDTFWLKQGNQKAFKVRLIAVDTFETKVNHRAFIQLDIVKNINLKNRGTIKQVLRYGYRAKEYVKRKILYKKVEFYCFGLDRYGRVLVWVNGLNWGLVRRGLATYYPNNKLSKRVKSLLLQASKDANKEGRGIYELRNR